ncbi:MAG: hypothetical protein RLO12_00215 [Fulvivirga sp.]
MKLLVFLISIWRSDLDMLLEAPKGAISLTSTTAFIYNNTFFVISTVAILTLTLSFAIFTYIRNADRRKNTELLEHEKKILREEFAQDLHDEIGNRLARIITFSNALEHNDFDLDSTGKKIINRISINSQQLYQSAYDLIRSKKDDAEDLSVVTERLSQFGNDMFQDTSVLFSSDVVMNRAVMLRPGQGRQIMLIFKEAMTNAFKHSECQSVTLKIRVGYAVILELIDNGKGFSADQKYLGMGLGGMKQRADKINATLKINSTIKGTKLKLVI